MTAATPARSHTLAPALQNNLVQPAPTDKHWSVDVSTWPRPLDFNEIPTPAFTLDVDAMQANQSAMREWVASHGAEIAPHGKTTLAPALWHWQLDEGATAITVANEFQLRIAHHHAIPRVIVANELLSPPGLRWLAGELSADFDVTCWVDSLNGVAQMDHLLCATPPARPLGVCVEVGYLGSRAGARTSEEASAIADAVRRSPHLELRGVSGFEAAVPGEGLPEKVQNIRKFLEQVRDASRRVLPLVEVEDPVVSVGGSAFFDLVVEVLKPVVDDYPGARLVLRSGAYLLHDDGLYQIVTPAATRSGPQLTPASRVFARVISVPEPDLAIIDAGKRDVPYDVLLPTVLSVLRDGREIAGITPSLDHLDDQHAYLHGHGLQVGDLVVLGTSHPCTLFDKWQTALLVSSGDMPVVHGVIATYF